MRSARALMALVLVTALLGVLASHPAGPSPARPTVLRPSVRPYPTHFPNGPGHFIAERACAICHSPMLTTQQRKDSTGWEKTLATMEKWGAPVSGADHDTLRTYLLSHFGRKNSSFFPTGRGDRAGPRRK